MPLFLFLLCLTSAACLQTRKAPHLCPHAPARMATSLCLTYCREESGTRISGSQGTERELRSNCAQTALRLRSDCAQTARTARYLLLRGTLFLRTHVLQWWPVTARCTRRPKPNWHHTPTSHRRCHLPAHYYCRCCVGCCVGCCSPPAPSKSEWPSIASKREHGRRCSHPTPGPTPGPCRRLLLKMNELALESFPPIVLHSRSFGLGVRLVQSTFLHIHIYLVEPAKVLARCFGCSLCWLVSCQVHYFHPACCRYTCCYTCCHPACCRYTCCHLACACDHLWCRGRRLEPTSNAADVVQIMRITQCRRWQ
jgi:hypothetical protein